LSIYYALIEKQNCLAAWWWNDYLFFFSAELFSCFYFHHLRCIF